MASSQMNNLNMLRNNDIKCMEKCRLEKRTSPRLNVEKMLRKVEKTPALCAYLPTFQSEILT